MGSVVAMVVWEFDFEVVDEDEDEDGEGADGKSWRLGDQYLAIGDGPMIRFSARKI